jgi:NAD dependent epimerase/dehydratase family enzyme
MSWIALDDLLGVLLTAITDERLSGPVNAVAAHPVTNREFTETLARVLHRPAVIPVPEAVLRLLPGGMGEEIFLASQRVEPARLQDIAFRFAFPTLEDTLRFELGRFDAAGERSPAMEFKRACATG